jgi:hypothetical protein
MTYIKQAAKKNIAISWEVDSFITLFSQNNRSGFLTSARYMDLPRPIIRKEIGGCYE